MINKQKFGVTLFIILFSYFLILMDNSIIFTSTVKIANDLNMSQAILAWVSNAYTITFGGFLLLAGRLGDLIGRKKIFITGLLIFGMASLFVGLSNSAVMIIVARAIQGIGSAIIAPTSLALLMDNYTGEMRSRAIAYYGATAGIGSSFGLLLGGWLKSGISGDEYRIELGTLPDVESESESDSNSILASEFHSDSASESSSDNDSISDSNNDWSNFPHNDSLPDTGMLNNESVQMLGELFLLLVLLGIKRRK
ncbi:copper resistance protein [Weissella oryzae SG25]|uniref:Copper resistance protein n=1 Tax=Weissella oryzae (strain DSM 25784 / JCM 18191 / LMG 30913 / SG25) TaxID=1329250 RepID=A0A069CSQ3_WEIOS|nr:copper resistance protein [Weissella oryzae SG25]